MRLVRLIGLGKERADGGDCRSVAQQRRVTFRRNGNRSQARVALQHVLDRLR
jgi:hypothetical protein